MIHVTSTLIRNRWAALQGKDLSALRISPVENKKEKQIVLSRIGTRIDDSNIVDEEIRDVAPSITEPEIEMESSATTSHLLNAMERRRLARDVATHRFMQDIEKKNNLLLLLP